VSRHAIEPTRDSPPARATRIGLFGVFGAGNIGNDGSLESMLAYLRAAHPDATLDIMCPGPKRIKAGYGIEGRLLQWYTKYANQTSGLIAIVLKSAGKGLDAFRTASWVRSHDLVIIPGTGILEATLPMRPTSTPYALYLACASGKLFRTKVALVSVGANVISQQLTKRIFAAAARLASYRSYRDGQSRDAMRRAGLDTSGDGVYPDLAFGLPTPPDSTIGSRTVGVGVMAYYGGNDDRKRADEVHASYTRKMTTFVRWLVDTDHEVRLFPGDDLDNAVTQVIMTEVLADRPDLKPTQITAAPVSSFSELMREVAYVSTVVATRYHNVLCALKLGKPTVSVGYAAKNDVLMAEMGLSEFCLSASTLDVDCLMERFTELERRSSELRPAIADCTGAKARQVAAQFAAVSSLISSAHEPVRESAQVAGA
jgi:polysaccharide pyruvyl transferase WcaK-like protein